MKNIGIIGAGNLGIHLHKMFKLNDLDNLVSISNQSHNNSNIIETSDIIFLTVKPKNIKTICEEIKQNNKWSVQKTIISAAAGVPTSKIVEWLGNNSLYNVMRFMPNIPISVGSGSIIWCDHSQINMQTKEILNNMFEGPKMIWVKDEELLDPATVVFGCLPAYLSKYFQVYLELGIKMGFTHEQTHSLLLNTFLGTSELLKEYEPWEIIQQVASKGGATEKGLEMLDSKGFSEIVKVSAFASLQRIQNITKSLD